MKLCTKGEKCTMDEKLELRELISMLMEEKEAMCLLTKDEINEMINKIKR